MDIFMQILDGISFGFLVLAIAAAGFSVYFTVSFIKSRNSLKAKAELTDEDKSTHRQKRKGMVALLVLFAVMTDLTLSAFAVRYSAVAFAPLFMPVNSTSLSDGVMTVSPTIRYTAKADELDVKVREGKLKKGGETSFTFKAEATGDYLFRITEMSDGMEIKIKLTKTNGDSVDYASGVKKYTVARMDGLEKGTRYRVTVTCIKGEGEFIMEQIPPKNFDIGYYSEIKDSIDYNYQSNVYFFTPKTDGVYCFNITGFGNDIGIEIPDSEETVYRGDGLAVVGLIAGKEYRIMVNQMSGHGSYTLNVMRQKTEVNISRADEVRDSFEFLGQHNYYSFRGKTEITLDIETQGTVMYLLVLDGKASTVHEIKSIRGYKTVTLDGLSADETYHVVLVALENTGEYRFYVRNEK